MSLKSAALKLHFEQPIEKNFFSEDEPDWQEEEADNWEDHFNKRIRGEAEGT